MFVILIMLAYFNGVSSAWRNKGHILKILGTRDKKEAAHKYLFLCSAKHCETKLVPSGSMSLLRRGDFVLIVNKFSLHVFNR